VRKSRKKPQIIRKKIFWANEKIRSPELLVIDENSVQLGVMPTRKALELAKQRDLDLVEVSPQGNPPVAKIMDYGQFKYQQDKQEHRQKAKQKKTETKGIRLSVRISDHDLDVRLKRGQKFLENGDKIKVEVTLRGREMQHQDLAREMLQKFIEETEKLVPINLEQKITKQGRTYSIILTKGN